MTQMADAAPDQATALHDVNTAIIQMDRVTQQNAALVEQSKPATLSLATETTTLARLIGQFKTGEAADQRARPHRRPAPPHP